jgi:hypothetical protein
VKTFGLYITLFIMAFILSFPESGNAFHDGGIAACEGCHTMHNSQNGAAMTNAYPQYQAGPYLLRGTDQSSVCLNCHEHAGDTGPSSFHISTSDIDMPTGSPPFQLTPGGDFGWLKKTYNWTGASGPQTSRGERHGHNIIAVDYGYTADSTHSSAPGGNPSPYPANARAAPVVMIRTVSSDGPAQAQSSSLNPARRTAHKEQRLLRHQPGSGCLAVLWAYTVFSAGFDTSQSR